MFKWVASMDMAANEEADANVLVKLCESFTDQAAQVGGANVLSSHRCASVNVQILLGCQRKSNFLSNVLDKQCVLIIALLCLLLTSNAIHNNLGCVAQHCANLHKLCSNQLGHI